MPALLCVAFPEEILVRLQIAYPDFYASCRFCAALPPSPLAGEAVLPVELYVSQIAGLSHIKSIPFGDRAFLEEAFSLGAADYLKNPWDCEELLIRTGRFRPSSLLLEQPLRIEIASSGLRVGTVIHPLSKREIQILTILACHRGRIVTHRSLAEHIGIRSARYENSLYVALSGLRKKLSLLIPDYFPRFFDIGNISSSGYVLTESVDKLCKNVDKPGINCP